MSDKDEFLRLRHIRDAIDRIQEYVGGISPEKFSDSPLHQAAVVCELQIIGEAARTIPKELQEQYPHIPWQLMISTRNFLVHEYFKIDAPRVWKVISDDLPELRASLVAIIGEQ